MHWFIKITHMIDNHIMHYSLCNILYLLFDFISFLGYHVVSINRTGSISNKTHIHTEVAPYSLILYSSSPLSLSYYLYFKTHYQHEGYPTEREGIFFFPKNNALHSSTEVLSNLFLIHKLYIIFFLCNDNCLIYFFSVILILLLFDFNNFIHEIWLY